MFGQNRDGTVDYLVDGLKSAEPVMIQFVVEVDFCLTLLRQSTDPGNAMRLPPA